MPESTVAATPAAPVPPKSEPASKADVDADKAESAPAEKLAPRTLKVPVPDIGDVDISEDEAREMLGQFAKLNAEDYKAKKELKELEAALDDDAKFEAFLKKKGKSPEKLAEALLKKHLAAQIEEETLSPEQKELRALKAERAKREADDKAKLEAEEKAKYEADVTARANKLREGIAAALKDSQIPAELHAEPGVLQRIKRLLERDEERGTQVPPSTIVKLVEQETLREFTTMASKMTAESLLKVLGTKRMESVIRAYAASVAPKEIVPEEKPKTRRDAAADELSPEELRRRARAASYEKAREEMALIRGAAPGRSNRYYGK